MEEWGGKEKITGKEQDSDIQRISTFLEKRGISLGFVWCGVFLFGCLGLVFFFQMKRRILAGVLFLRHPQGSYKCK